MKKILLVLSFIAISSCATQTFNMDSGNTVQPTRETTHHFFISGLGQSKQVDAAEVCGGADKVSRVETQVNFLNALLSGVTSGIYTPRTARVYCKL